jgi:DNA mismatch repair ATPase MutS
LKIPTTETYIKTDSIDDEIYKALVILFPKEFKLIKEFFDEIKDFYDESLKKIVLDMRFYFIYIAYMNFLKSDDIYFSIPELSNDFNEESVESFDLALYYKLFKEHNKIVTNSYKITNDERMIIITGPNQGGKTTFTRQIGQLHYLASLGLLIPGLKNKIHIVDNIYTFFKTEENLDNLDGKLKIELESVKKILSEASKNSLILFNEIFASTTKLDGLKIANLIMDEINNLGSMCVFVTFLTDLKSRKDVILMCSNVSKDNSAIRTFKITRTDNFDSAYPSSIQNKYGLTYQEIKERLK